VECRYWPVIAIRTKHDSEDDGVSSEVLRLGPAPYVRDDQLRDAIQVLGEILTSRRSG
jgi:hypothetical protein